MNKTFWHHHPETVDRIAAEYALGTLAAPARRRLDTLMSQRRDVAHAVWAWNERLGGVLAAQQPLPVSAAAWTRLESQVFGTQGGQMTRIQKWWLRLLAPIPAGALALGLLIGSMLGPVWEASRSSTQLPESYVGVLANSGGKPGLIVSSLRRGTTVDLKQLSPVKVPEGQTLFLWTIDKDGVVFPVSAVPNGKFVSAPLPAAAETVFFPALELAISVEAVGTNPDKPSGPFVYRGLCGKLWKLPGT